MSYVRFLRHLCVLLAPFTIAGCDLAVLSPVGPIGDANRTILLDSLIIMLAIVVPTGLAILGFVWWFRDSNPRARRQPDFTYSGRVELIVWAIPALVVFFLGGIAWIGSHLLDPGRPIASRMKPLDIQVVSLDWKWLFIYPEQGVASLNEMVAPAGVPLRLQITSATVWNSFFVPRAGSMIYSMYGMATPLNLEVDRPGIYPGLSAHFSGDGFSDMAFDLRAVSADEFSAWTTAAGSSGPVLDEPAYRALLKQSQNDPPHTFRSVEAGLFDDIVMQKLPAGAGPEPTVAGPEPTIRPED